MLPLNKSMAIGDTRSSMSALGWADDHDPLKDIELPGRPPLGFDHLSSTHDELLKHGLPPPPDREMFPEQYRQWEHIFSKLPVLASEASIKAISQDSQTVHGLAPRTLSQDVSEIAGTQHSSSWSGAIIENVENVENFEEDWLLNKPKGDTMAFGMVSASWTVGRPYPPSSSRKAAGWANGHFEASTWVGMDGSTSPKMNNIESLRTHGLDYSLFPYDVGSLLCAGIAQRCIVKDGGMEVITYPWFAWHPSPPVEISGFAVNPGDLVTIFIGGFSLGLGNYWRISRQQPITRAFVFFYNRSNCTYFSAIVNAPFGASLGGHTAEWIVQCPFPPQQATTPFLGTTFIHDCWFIGNGAMRDLGDAVLSNAVVNGGKDILLRAVRENNSVLGIFSQSRPDDIQISTSQKSPRVVVYHQSEASLSPLVYVPLVTGRSLPAVTHVNIAAFHLNEDEHGEIWVTLNNSRPDDSTFATLWKDVKILQAYGVKVLAMLGGGTGGVFSRLDKATDTDTFKKSYAAIKNVIDTYRLDGVDLDVEEDMSQTGINTLIDRLVDDFGKNFIITLAPVASALSDRGNLSGFDYATLEENKGNKIAWYNAQFYNGWGSMTDTEDYDEIIKSQKFKPAKVVASVLTNPTHGNDETYVKLDTLKETLQNLVKKYGYGEFGGVAGWEYVESRPVETAPWDWAQIMRDTLAK